MPGYASKEFYLQKILDILEGVMTKGSGSAEYSLSRIYELMSNGEWLKVSNINSEGSTSGQTIVSNGTGGAYWGTVPGSGGSIAFDGATFSVDDNVSIPGERLVSVQLTNEGVNVASGVYGVNLIAVNASDYSSSFFVRQYGDNFEEAIIMSNHGVWYLLLYEDGYDTPTFLVTNPDSVNDVSVKLIIGIPNGTTVISDAFLVPHGNLL